MQFSTFYFFWKKLFLNILSKSLKIYQKRHFETYITFLQISSILQFFAKFLGKINNSKKKT